ncbi:hypothetical protein SETIT_5G349000v2 [Setaria italica]|uniref:Bifunctional inhibitor/plant lipid transfer protein/seed storage helical domain-containing protein n=2 Tax=Setaria italica TaxID=4555 RepID=A0A368RCD2_SETIT|nr:hypothetical protein SETIT_5G349000v2 [Setaria italica]
MANDSLRVFLVLLLSQVCLLVAMAASAVQGRSGPRPLMMESTPECCLYHPDCCQVQANAVAAAPHPGP